MLKFEDDSKQVASTATGKALLKRGRNGNMKEYLESKKKEKIASKKEGEEMNLAPGEVSEIERNFAKYFPKEMLELLDEKTVIAR